MLTPEQARTLAECAHALHAPGRIVVTGGGSEAVAEVLRGSVAPGVDVLAVAPDALDEVDGPLDVLVVGPTAPYTVAVDTLERWSARVVPAGTLFVLGAFSSPPLTAALLRTIGSSPGWRYFGRTGALAEYTRADLRRAGRALNAIAQVAQLPSFARSSARRRVARRRS